jgi:hypothetical protein
MAANEGWKGRMIVPGHDRVRVIIFRVVDAISTTATTSHCNPADTLIVEDAMAAIQSLAIGQ